MNHSQRIVCGLLLAVVLSSAARAADAPKGERYALLVGVRQYSEAKELRPLPYAENDVTELAQVLKDGGYKPENVVLLTQTVGADQLRYLPLKARVLKELDLLLKNRDEDDTVLLAFAGHGVVFKGDDDSYFCPADTQLDDRDTLLSLTDVYRALEKCKAGTKVLLVDACRNDPLADKSRAVPKLDMDSATRPPAPAKDGGVAAFFSCSRGQKAYEDDRSKHGAFFHYVIEGLKGEAAPGKDDVTLLELEAYVQRRVADFARSEYGANQMPDVNNSTVRGTAALWQAADFLQAYRRGKKLLADKEYARAEAEFSEAIRLNQNYALAFKERGRVRQEKGQLDKAIADYDEAVRLDPKYAPAFNNRGNVWRNKGEYDKAIADFDQAIRLDPKLAAPFINRGRTWHDKGELDKAMADYDEAIRLDPKNAVAFANRGNVQVRKEDLDKAIADYDEAIHLDPKYAPGFSGRGNAWYHKKDLDKAMADYDEAIRLDPKSSDAFNGRGNIWYLKRDPDRAIAEYDEAIRFDPTFAMAFNNRARVWYHKKEYDKGIADSTEAIRLDPNFAEAFNMRGEAWVYKQEYDKAIADLTEAIRLDPKMSRALYSRGNAWYHKQEYDKAIADYGEAVRLNPKYADAFYNRGLAYQAKGDKEAAEADFKKADQLDKMK